MTLMDPPSNLKPAGAIARILAYERVSFRKVCPAIVKAVNGGKVDVELLQQDKFLGEEDKPTEPQRVKLSNLPLCSFGSSEFVLDVGVDVGDEVLVLCADRSVRPWREAAAAEPAPTDDSALHHFNGAMVLPIEISLVRLAEGRAPGKMLIGTKDESARFEIEGTTITAKASTIKLGSASASAKVANGDTCDTNFDIVKTHTNAVGTILGVPPIPSLSSVGLTKVKGE